jgi:hypothetical protein
VQVVAAPLAGIGPLAFAFASLSRMALRDMPSSSAARVIEPASSSAAMALV